MSSIAFEHITKRYGDGFEAVKDMNLEIADGEFMVLLGPSGSGKSTALRMVAGLEDITDGVLKIGDEVVNHRAPKDRDIAMVFQSYALYPHMTVRENMSFALKLAKVPRAQIDAKVNEAARSLGLEQHLERKPAQLSGGQRQRVAMGRAIVRDPRVFLMDEPLSNLDAKLRLQTRTEISRIQRQLGTTTIYVTHDQVEALTLGDRMAVMREGSLEQVGAPNDVYAHPDNIFVAGFIGSPSMNFVSGRFDDGLLRTAIGDVTISDALRRRLPPTPPGDGRVVVGIRPEHLEDAALVGDPSRGHTFKVKVDVLESLGSEHYVHFTVKGDRAAAELERLADEAVTAELGRSAQGIPLVARVGAGSRVSQDHEAKLWLDTTHLHLFDPESGRNLAASEREPTDASAPTAKIGDPVGDVVELQIRDECPEADVRAERRLSN